MTGSPALVLRQAARAIDRLITARTQDLGIKSPSALQVLLVLQDKPGLNGADLARHLSSSYYKLTTMDAARELALLGLIRRTSDPRQPRSLRNYLTAKGQCIAAQARRVQDDIEAELGRIGAMSGVSFAGKLERIAALDEESNAA